MGPFFYLVDDEVEGPELLEGKLVDDDQGVLTAINHHMDDFFLLDGRK